MPPSAILNTWQGAFFWMGVNVIPTMAGVYKSNDGGQNWSATGLTYQLTNGDGSLIRRKILVNPVQLTAGAGVWREWYVQKAAMAALHGIKYSALPFLGHGAGSCKPFNYIYAATGWVKNANMGYAGIYKSTDFGGSGLC